MPGTNDHYEKKYRVTGGKQEKVDVFNLARHMINQAISFIPGYPNDRPFSRSGLIAIVGTLIDEINLLEKEIAPKSTKERKRYVPPTVPGLDAA